MAEISNQTVHRKDWIPGVSRAIYESDKKTKIAWKRYPEDILEGEVRYMLERNGATAYPSEVLLVSRVIKVYVNNPELFYIPEEKGQNKKDAGIGELLKNRVKGRKKEEDEARKIMKVWLNSDLDGFLNSIASLIRFNAKHEGIIPLNDLFRLCKNQEMNPGRNIQNISSGFFHSRKPKNTSSTKSNNKEGDEK